MSNEVCLETINNPIYRMNKSNDLNLDGFFVVPFNVLDRYLKSSVALEKQLVWNQASRGDNLYSQEVMLAVEKIAFQPFMSDDLTARRESSYATQSVARYDADNSKSAVSIEPSQVVDVFQSVVQATIRVTDRFVSRARLYRSHPVNELLREWESVETIVLDIIGLPCGREGKIQTTRALCVGGNLGTLRVGDCIPNQSIQSRSELICKLTEYERESIRSDSFDRFGRELDGQDMPPGVFFLTNYGSRAFLVQDGSPFSIECLTMNVRSINPVLAIFEIVRSCPIAYQTRSVNHVIALMSYCFSHKLVMSAWKGRNCRPQPVPSQRSSRPDAFSLLPFAVILTV